MPAYDICYMHDDGALASSFTVQFDSEMRAKILAHAMKPADCHRLEVWDSKTLIYRRALLDERRPAAHTQADEFDYIGSPA
jgi:hypothetical protein